MLKTRPQGKREVSCGGTQGQGRGGNHSSTPMPLKEEAIGEKFPEEAAGAVVRTVLIFTFHNSSPGKSGMQNFTSI